MYMSLHVFIDIEIHINVSGDVPQVINSVTNIIGHRYLIAQGKYT